MKVSVIIPNHGRDLTNALESIKRSTYRSVDVLVIDRGAERSLQRNWGIQEAEGEAFLILDSDQSVSPGLIEECVSLVKMGFSSVYIPEIIVASGFFGKVRKFEREFYTGTAVDVPRFVIKNACPMFDIEQKGPEDSDWGNRIPGLRAISKNVLYHNDEISILDYFKKKAYYAKSMKRFKERNPKDPVLNPYYRCFKVYTEKGKWKKILRHPVLFACILLMVFIRGIIYVRSS